VLAIAVVQIPEMQPPERLVVHFPETFGTIVEGLTEITLAPPRSIGSSETRITDRSLPLLIVGGILFTTFGLLLLVPEGLRENVQRGARAAAFLGSARRHLQHLAGIELLSQALQQKLEKKSKVQAHPG